MEFITSSSERLSCLRSRMRLAGRVGVIAETCLVHRLVQGGRESRGGRAVPREVDSPSESFRAKSPIPSSQNSESTVARTAQAKELGAVESALAT